MAHAISAYDSRVAILLMKLVRVIFIFLYVLMDKGYLSAEIQGFTTIIDWPACSGVADGSCHGTDVQGPDDGRVYQQ